MRAHFKTNIREPLTVAVATWRLQDELERLGGDRAVLSSNVERRLDGLPRSNRPEPGDPGVAVYFTLNRKRVVLACDRWDRVADNIGAIAWHIRALRAIERYGVGTIEQAFRGYQSLPAPGARPWRDVLGIGDRPVTLQDVIARWRNLAAEHHPDRGGNPQQMAEINAAMDQARAEFSRAEGSCCGTMRAGSEIASASQSGWMDRKTPTSLG